MRDELGAAKQRLAREIDSNSALPSKPIAADPWVISSLLQKSIRRGERGLAQRAAFTFFHLKGAAVWRRLMVIAFEDVGIGSVDAVTTTVAAAGDSAWRKNHGGDLKLAVYLAGLLAEAPKDRSADYLCDARDHSMLTDFWRAMEKASLESRERIDQRSFLSQGDSNRIVDFGLVLRASSSANWAPPARHRPAMRRIRFGRSGESARRRARQ